ncbi:MAG: hypothetical protein ACR5K9_07245 [Wolbachia sp.]
MGAIKISRFLLNKNNEVTEQHNKPTGKKNLYTILGFKSREGFKNQINKLLSSGEEQLKELQDNLWHRFEKKIKGDKGSNKSAKNIYDIIEESEVIENKLDNLLEFKNQLQSFIKDQDDRSIVLNAIVPTHVIEVNGIYPEDRDIKKLKKSQPLISDRHNFEDTLKYIESQEKAIGITLEELREYKKHPVKIFLLNYINQLGKKYLKLWSKTREAVAILSSDELRNFYDKSVEEGVLQPIPSHKQCKNLYDKINQLKNESKGVTERKERTESKSAIDRKEQNENLRETDKSVTSIISDIKKYREAILNCKNFQSSYIQEKKEHPLRGNSYQKMIDIYQERIAGYQEKIRQNLTQIREIFQSMPQEISSSYGMGEFEEYMHEAKQVDENFDSALSIIQNSQLEKTELSVGKNGKSFNRARRNFTYQR